MNVSCMLTRACMVDYWVVRPVIRDTWEYKVDDKLIKHYEFYAFCKKYVLKINLRERTNIRITQYFFIRKKFPY